MAQYAGGGEDPSIMPLFFPLRGVFFGGEGEGVLMVRGENLHSKTSLEVVEVVTARRAGGLLGSSLGGG